jgi:hypothetical protein
MRVEVIRWTDEDEQQLQQLIGHFAQCSYGGGSGDAKQMQMLRKRIHVLSTKKALSGATGAVVDVEFGA